MIREESALRQALLRYLHANPELRTCDARALHDALRRFMVAELAAGRLQLSAESKTPWRWWVRQQMHLITLPLVTIVLLPVLALVLPFYAMWLRGREGQDPEVCPAVAQEYSDEIARSEDHGVSNPFSAIGSLKPGLLRLSTLIGVLTTVDYAARHIVRPGRLGRVRSIHFARWAFIGSKRRMAFFSNYDGSFESYMDDFINKAGFALNAVFGNAIGYPRTRWLIGDGCADERKYKEYLRRHTIATQVWYKAYPDLTAADLERNTRIRRGLVQSTIGPLAVQQWACLL
jgi:hypothetical protein